MQDSNGKEKKNSEKKHPRFFRALLTAACALLFICVACGVGYAYFLGTTDTVRNPFDVSQRIYTQKLQVRYENADGSFTDYQTLLDRKFKYGSASEWTWKGHAQDDTYQYSAPITFADDEDKTMQVSVMRRKVTLDFNMIINSEAMPSPTNICGFDLYVNDKKVFTVDQNSETADAGCENVRAGSTYEFRNFRFWWPDDFPDNDLSWTKGTIDLSKKGEFWKKTGYYVFNPGSGDKEYYGFWPSVNGRDIYVDINAFEDGVVRGVPTYAKYNLQINGTTVSTSGDLYKQYKAGSRYSISDCGSNDNHYVFTGKVLDADKQSLSTSGIVHAHADPDADNVMRIYLDYRKQYHHVAQARYQDVNGNWSGYSVFFDTWGPSGQKWSYTADSNVYNNSYQEGTFGEDQTVNVDFSRKTQTFTWSYRLYTGNAYYYFKENTGQYGAVYLPNQFGGYQYYSEVHYVGWSGTWTYQPNQYYESHTWWPGNNADFGYSLSHITVRVHYQKTNKSWGGSNDLGFDVPQTSAIYIGIVQNGYRTCEQTYFTAGGSPNFFDFWLYRP